MKPRRTRRSASLHEVEELEREIERLQLEDTRHCACKLGEGFPIRVEWLEQCNYHRDQEAEIERLRAWIGTEELMSDFKSAQHMRDTLNYWKGRAEAAEAAREK